MAEDKHGSNDGGNYLDQLIALYTVERLDTQNTAAVFVSIVGVVLTYITGASIVLLTRTGDRLPDWVKLCLPLIPVALFGHFCAHTVGDVLRGRYLRDLEREIVEGTRHAGVPGVGEYPYFSRLIAALIEPSRSWVRLPIAVGGSLTAVAFPLTIVLFVVLTALTSTHFLRWPVSALYIMMVVLGVLSYVTAQHSGLYDMLREEITGSKRNVSSAYQPVDDEKASRECRGGLSPTPAGSPPGDYNARPIDHAAVFGAALAAVIALTVGEGPWTSVTIIIGFLLLAVVFGFYRVPIDVSWREAIAVGGVVAICAAVVFAWPLQEVLSRQGLLGIDAVRRCEQLGREARARAITSRDPTPPSAVGDTVSGNCQGYETTQRLWWIAVPVGVIAPLTIRRRAGRAKSTGRGDVQSSHTASTTETTR